MPQGHHTAITIDIVDVDDGLDDFVDVSEFAVTWFTLHVGPGCCHYKQKWFYSSLITRMKHFMHQAWPHIMVIIPRSLGIAKASSCSWPTTSMIRTK